MPSDVTALPLPYLRPLYCLALLPKLSQEQQLSSFWNDQVLQLKNKVAFGQFVVKLEVILNFYV